MKREGLTLTMIFFFDFANYGEGVGNISTLKKMSSGNYQQFSYISRQAMRYNIIQQLKWDNTPVDGKSGVVQFDPGAYIDQYPEIDLFGYMKTVGKDDQSKGGAFTRSAVARLSNAISLEPYQNDMEFLTNMGLAKRNGLENGIAQSEIHRSYYTYTVSIDLDRVGVDGEINIPSSEKADRVKKLLDALQYLYRDIKGRRENLSPVFVIGGRYERKNPFFENRIKVENNRLKIQMLKDILEDNMAESNTFVGVLSNMFDNDNEIKEKLSAETVGKAFDHLKEEVDAYYGE